MRKSSTVLAIVALLIAVTQSRTADEDSGLNDEGFLTTWLLLAPIPMDKDQSGADALGKEQLKDEAKLQPKADDKVTVGGKELVWKKYQCKESYFDFNAYLGKETEDSVGYAVCYIHAAAEMKDIHLKTGSDDQAKVYLNGKEVFKFDEARPLELDEDTTEVTLKKGVNVLVFKVVNEKEDWSGCARFMDKDGKVIKNLRVTAGADQAPPAAAKLEAIKKEFANAEAAYRRAAKELPDTPEGEKKSEELWKELDKKQSDAFVAAVELAKADPKSDTAFAALEWVLTIPRAYYLPAGKPAMELATEHYANSAKVGKIVAWVGYFGPSDRDDRGAWREADALLKAVLEKNPDRAARGQVAFTQARKAMGRFAVAEYKRSPDTDALAKEAEKAFEDLLKDYGDCPSLMRENSGTLGERAKRELNELRNLRVGKVAPEIEGEDLDGVKFKLSDYRGKVVALDFWGHW